eukprot:Gb_22232 [translate_table: standard]
MTSHNPPTTPGNSLPLPTPPSGNNPPPTRVYVDGIKMKNTKRKVLFKPCRELHWHVILLRGLEESRRVSEKEEPVCRLVGGHTVEIVDHTVLQEEAVPGTPMDATSNLVLRDITVNITMDIQMKTHPIGALNDIWVEVLLLMATVAIQNSGCYTFTLKTKTFNQHCPWLQMEWEKIEDDIESSTTTISVNDEHETFCFEVKRMTWNLHFARSDAKFNAHEDLHEEEGTERTTTTADLIPKTQAGNFDLHSTKILSVFCFLEIFPLAVNTDKVGGRRSSVSQPPPTKAPRRLSLINPTPTKLPPRSGRSVSAASLTDERQFLASHTVAVLPPAFQDLVETQARADDSTALRLNPLAKNSNTFQRPRRLTLVESTIATHISHRLPHWRSVGNATQGFTWQNQPSPHLNAIQGFTWRNHTSPHLITQPHRLSLPLAESHIATSSPRPHRLSLSSGINHRQALIQLPTSTICRASVSCYGDLRRPQFDWLLLHSHTGFLSFWQNQPSPGSHPTAYIGTELRGLQRLWPPTASSVSNGRVYNGSLASMPCNGSLARLLLRLLQMHA